MVWVGQLTQKNIKRKNLIQGNEGNFFHISSLRFEIIDNGKYELIGYPSITEKFNKILTKMKKEFSEKKDNIFVLISKEENKCSFSIIQSGNEYFCYYIPKKNNEFENPKLILHGKGLIEKIVGVQKLEFLGGIKYRNSLPYLLQIQLNFKAGFGSCPTTINCLFNKEEKILQNKKGKLAYNSFFSLINNKQYQNPKTVNYWQYINSLGLLKEQKRLKSPYVTKDIFGFGQSVRQVNMHGSEKIIKIFYGKGTKQNKIAQLKFQGYVPNNFNFGHLFFIPSNETSGNAYLLEADKEDRINFLDKKYLLKSKNGKDVLRMRYRY